QALVLYAADRRLEAFFGASVHGAPDHADFLLATSIHVGRVLPIALDYPRGVLPPDDSMTGRHYPHAEGVHLVDRALHEGPEARDDVGIIAEGLDLEALVLARVELVVEDAVAEHAEAAERVAGKEGSRGRLEGDHGLGPMNVGRLHEG